MKISFAVIFSFFTLLIQSQESWLIDKYGCKVHNPYPRNGESVEWQGECLNGFAEGKGKLIWYMHGLKTQNIFEGIMKKGKPEGEGKYSVAKGEYFKGEFKNGEFYYGEAYQTIGQSKYYYRGYFINYQLEGKGELEIKGEQLYTGEFKLGDPHGYGLLKYEDGDSFEGTFDKGYYKSGTFKSASHNYTVESTNWKLFSALSGKLTYEDGTIYIGDLKFDLPHGIGILYYSDGSSLEGLFKKGIIRGEATFYCPDGIIYKCNTSKGLMHGQGTITYPNGNEYKGSWEKGVFIKSTEHEETI